jgi:hypothetical protein
MGLAPAIVVIITAVITILVPGVMAAVIVEAVILRTFNAVNANRRLVVVVIGSVAVIVGLSRGRPCGESGNTQKREDKFVHSAGFDAQPFGVFTQL